MKVVNEINIANVFARADSDLEKKRKDYQGQWMWVSQAIDWMQETLREVQGMLPIENIEREEVRHNE